MLVAQQLATKLTCDLVMKQFVIDKIKVIGRIIASLVKPLVLCAYGHVVIKWKISFRRKIFLA